MMVAHLEIYGANPNCLIQIPPRRWALSHSLWESFRNARHDVCRLPRNFRGIWVARLNVARWLARLRVRSRRNFRDDPVAIAPGSDLGGRPRPTDSTDMPTT